MEVVEAACDEVEVEVTEELDAKVGDTVWEMVDEEATVI